MSQENLKVRLRHVCAPMCTKALQPMVKWWGKNPQVSINRRMDRERVVYPFNGKHPLKGRKIQFSNTENTGDPCTEWVFVRSVNSLQLRNKWTEHGGRTFRSPTSRLMSRTVRVLGHTVLGAWQQEECSWRTQIWNLCLFVSLSVHLPTPLRLPHNDPAGKVELYSVHTWWKTGEYPAFPQETSKLMCTGSPDSGAVSSLVQ